ncbi:MAG TPA: hypothetical protein VE990_15665 [Acidimicrobiales bacterium]|nr:hypothetical protein [Acidimicrobiales bacterium]
MTDSDTITRAGGTLRSAERRPHMRVRAGAGSIHDDATAQGLGFRGGTIAGSIHMDQFPALLVEAFGQRWFETGTLSLSFKHATISGEPVVAVVGIPPEGADVQVEARTEQPDGTVVAEGTASVGRPDPATHLYSVDLRPSPPDQLRMLAGLAPGSPLGHQASVSSGPVRERVEAGGLPDPLGWFSGPSPWGGPIANPSSVVQLLRNRGNEFGPHVRGAVGLFGAIEIRHHGGPVLLDTTYQVTGEVVAVGASPRTEYVWYDTAASDEDGKLVASMRMQLRWMTASSPLYQDGGQG